jgi:hypothetical protein
MDAIWSWLIGHAGLVFSVVTLIVGFLVAYWRGQLADLVSVVIGAMLAEAKEHIHEVSSEMVANLANFIYDEFVPTWIATLVSKEKFAELCWDAWCAFVAFLDENAQEIARVAGTQ